MIYIVSHKNVPFLGNHPNGYQPLLVGANKDAIAHDLSDSQRDDVGENIADLNPFFCELTGLYWVWRNVDDDIKGIVHYRRYFTGGDTNQETDSAALPFSTISEILSDVDCIVPNARPLLQSVLNDYSRHHEASDLYLVRDAVARLQPDFLKSFDSRMSERYIYPYNMLVARASVFDAYCSWLFPLLFDVYKHLDLSDRDEYECRAIGFLSERLLAVWLSRSGFTWREMTVTMPERGLKERMSMAIAAATAGARPVWMDSGD